MFEQDISTGLIPITDDYMTIGPQSTWHIKNEIPESPKPVCYILALLATCEFEEYWAVVNGSAVVRDYIVVGIDTERNRGIGGGDSEQKILRGRDGVVRGEDVEIARERVYAEWEAGTKAVRRKMPPFF